MDEPSCEELDDPNSYFTLILEGLSKVMNIRYLLVLTYLSVSMQ